MALLDCAIYITDFTPRLEETELLLFTATIHRPEPNPKCELSYDSNRNDLKGQNHLFHRAL